MRCQSKIYVNTENLDLKLSEADDYLRSLLVSPSHPRFPPSSSPSLRHNGLYPSISVTMLILRLISLRRISAYHYMTEKHTSINAQIQSNKQQQPQR